ncbi:MAG: NAD(P)/FAD-dependent oxidoreductase [Eubacteriales bacterium]
MQYDVIIIGAGVTGCAAAYKLARYKLRVLVLEAGSDVACGTTKANSAIVHAGFDAQPGTLKAKLNVSGCAQMPKLCSELDVMYSNCGSLVCASGEDEMKTLQSLLERGRENGVERLEIITGERLYEMEPRLSHEITGALWAPTAGIVCPWGLCIAMAECASVNGVDFRFGYKATEVCEENGSMVVSDGSRCIAARYVINCAGLYADDLPVCGKRELPIEIIPRRGEYLLLDSAFADTVSHTVFTVPSERGKGILISPTVHGNIIVGPNANRVECKADTATTDAGIAEVSSGARRLVPDINLRGAITAFAGVRATPSSHDFYIERSGRCPHLLHAAGIESPGLASSPAVGDYIVEKLGDMGLELNENPKFINSRPPVVRFAHLSDEEKSALIAKDPAYGRIVCRCETITEGEIVDSIRRPLGARDLDGVKRRVRAGMGRCQGGFCSPRVTDILARELHCSLSDITKNGPASRLLSAE